VQRERSERAERDRVRFAPALERRVDVECDVAARLLPRDVRIGTGDGFLCERDIGVLAERELDRAVEREFLRTRAGCICMADAAASRSTAARRFMSDLVLEVNHDLDR